MTEQNKYPKISIIIPTYNRAGLIMETIRSILEQTYSNWELIIVDDGSDDNTEELIGKINDKRIRYIKEPRSGMGARMRNKGMNESNGELIAFNDSDDCWDKTKLEKQVAALLQYPEAGFCLTNGYNFRVAHEPLDFFYKKREGSGYGDIFTGIFSSEIAGFAQALLFKKECLDKVGLFKEEKMFSDYDFITTLASHFKAVILYEPLVFRRLHPSNSSGDHWEQFSGEGIAFIRSYRSKLPSSIYKNALFKAHINLGEKYLEYKQKKKALQHFFKAWRYKPWSIVPFKKMAKTILQTK